MVLKRLILWKKLYVYDWDSGEKKLNSNHDAEHYDYFFKGN